MQNIILSTKLVFNEIKNAVDKNSEILEIDFELELENSNPRIYSVLEDENWGTLGLFFKVKNQDLFYVVNVEKSETNEVINAYCYNKYQISLNVMCTENINELINMFKIKPKYRNDFNYESGEVLNNALKSVVGFEFELKPNFLQNQILEFLDIMNSDKTNFQKLFNKNLGVLSIGIPKNDNINDFTPLPEISNELINRLSEYNLSIQFGKIIKN